MATARIIEPLGKQLGSATEGEARSLARILPRLALEARQAAAQVALGIHGRRRAGPGETFWQFRQFASGEPADRIDWRRSARDDRLYVREREWESASTYWLWIDCSPSMNYISSLAKAAKRDRALVLGLAIADLLVRGGERVGLLGLSPPMVSRNIITRLVEALMHSGSAGAKSFPEGLIPGPRDRMIFLSDFIVDASEFRSGIATLSSRGARGLAVQIRDPAESLFPFSGQTEFTDPENQSRWMVGDAHAVASAYHQRLAAHEGLLGDACKATGWSFRKHGTENTATEGLLSLAMLLQSGSTPSWQGGR